jgi:hypothetical protein
VKPDAVIIRAQWHPEQEVFCSSGVWGQQDVGALYHLTVQVVRGNVERVTHFCVQRA